MVLKNAVRKARIGLKVLRDEGLRSFTIRSLRLFDKKLSQNVRTKGATQQLRLIDTKVKYRDALAADYTQARPKWPGTTKKKLAFNWLMLPPGKGSGGHLNIFRFIKYLEEAGHDCQIYIYTQHAPGRVSDIRTLMGDSYPKLHADMTWIDSGDEMRNADGIFATSWDSAYASFNSKAKGKRFYFVQDFEPYFYPVGSISSLAENTYKFGFYGVTAGKWLATKLHRDYGMQTDYFNFGSDKDIYKFVNEGERKEIFFYARPYTERRGFELGVMALELFNKQHPEYIINLAGWDVSDYNIPFPYNNLATLEISQLNDLYNRCAAGLVMSLTNMSLLPLELLGSGTIPVVNEGENNQLVSTNPYIAYAANNPAALARELSRIVERKNVVQYARDAADSIKSDSWDKSGAKFVSIIERETRKSE